MWREFPGWPPRPLDVRRESLIMETIPRKTRESNLGVVSKDKMGGAGAILPFVLVNQLHLCKQVGRKIFTRKTNFILKKNNCE